ncbi:T9SS type A sorting domain-containing protein [Cryomorphaceae bacterium 1068]|nr:T9SS type A sorting domain-containing protein [Cryomorphaceae bacterium 1068]
MRMFNMKRSPFVLLLVLVGLSAQAQNDFEPYSFFVAGHVYGAVGANNIGVHPPFKAKFPYVQSRSEIEFGVFAGDIVPSTPVAQDWEEIDADVEDLGIPVHFVAGNHEVRNLPLFEARYGDTYFDFTYNNDLFIILDANIDGWSIAGDQLEYLKNVINGKCASIEKVFVFFHQILWRDDDQFNHISPNSYEGRVAPVNFWTTVIPIFDSITNDVYIFAGDLGASWSSVVSYDRYNNITFIASGMGGQDGDNFVVVNIDSDKTVSYDLICLNDQDLFCLGELNDYLTVDITTSTESEEQTGTNFIYPNPSDQFINVSTNQASILQLYDMKGALILEENCNEYSNQPINISQLQNGLYTAKLSSESETRVQKLIIQ